MNSRILERRVTTLEAAQRMLPGREEAPKRLFVWICGQVSSGRK
jgi:hypothetical protein